MAKERKGGNAFPIGAAYPYDQGMSLRDYFAAKAMQGLMAVYWDMVEEYESPQALLKCQVETAYEYADAMLAEREK